MDEYRKGYEDGYRSGYADAKSQYGDLLYHANLDAARVALKSYLEEKKYPVSEIELILRLAGC